MSESPGKKTPFNTRLTPEAHDLLAKLAAKLGLGLTGTLELAIRELAKKEKVK